MCWRYDCTCTNCSNIFKKHVATFIFCLSYWVMEIVILIIWLSFGIGVSFLLTYLFQETIGLKLSNAWQTYVTIYIMACAVIFQTNCSLTFIQLSLQEVYRRAPLAYTLYKTIPLRIVIVISYVQLFSQYRLRYSNLVKGAYNSSEDQEDMATNRFLLALVLIIYVLGRKCRQDYRIDEARTGIIFFCPGVFKYCYIFSMFYTFELVQLLVWTLPVLITAVFFRLYYFEEHVAYFSLSVTGVMMGVVSASVERLCGCTEPFYTNPMDRIIHGDVKTNVLLFSIAPVISRWYFQIQLDYADYRTAQMVNFLLFSVNVAVFLFYTVKQICFYKFKERDERLRRIRNAQNPIVAPTAPPPDMEPSVDTISTGSFSSDDDEEATDGNHHHHRRRHHNLSSSYDPTGPEASIGSTNNNNSSYYYNIDFINQNYNNNNTNEDQHQTKRNSQSHQITFGPSSPQYKTSFNLRPNNSPSTQKDNLTTELPVSPLSHSLGIFKIDKQWRNEMMVHSTPPLTRCPSNIELPPHHHPHNRNVCSSPHIV